MKELQRQASPNIVIALAGNKADLSNKRMVEFEVSWMVDCLVEVVGGRYVKCVEVFQVCFVFCFVWLSVC